jgi:hypothetical protein
MATRLWRWPIVGVVLLSLGGVAVVLASGFVPRPSVRWESPSAEAATSATSGAGGSAAPAQPAPDVGSVFATSSAPPTQVAVAQAGPAVQWVSPTPGSATAPAAAPSAPQASAPVLQSAPSYPPPASQGTAMVAPAQPAPGYAVAPATAPATGYAAPGATSAGRGALQACMPDFRTLCAGIQPGEGRGVQCLLQHGSELSAGCREALNGARPAAPAAPVTGVAMRAAIEACWQDFSVLCAGVQPGEGRGAMCLREHATQLSPGCRDALLAARAH